MPDERKRIVNLQEASTLSAAMCFVEDSTDGTGTRKVTFENLQNTINQTGAANNLAPAYDATNTYNVGEMCTYQGRLYVCTTQISTAEAWTAGHWTAVKVGEKISDLNNQINNIETVLDIHYDTLPISLTYANSAYINSSGIITTSSAWRLRYFKLADIEPFSKIRFISTGTTVDRYQVAFYSTETPQNEGFIAASSIKYSAANTECSVDITEIPAEAQCVAIALLNEYESSVTWYSLQQSKINILDDLSENIDFDYRNYDITGDFEYVNSAYISADGEITASSSWRMFTIQTSELRPWSKITVSGKQVTTGRYMVGYYSSAVPSNATFLGGLKTSVANAVNTKEITSLPTGTVCIAVTYSEDNTTFSVVLTSESKESNVDANTENIESLSERRSQIDRAMFDNQFNYIAYSGFSVAGMGMNTAEHYEWAGQHKYTSIKGDVRLSSDGEIVMCHDAGFTINDDNQITTYSQSDNVLIHDRTAAEWFAMTYTNGKHPCGIDALIRACKIYGKIAYITVRSDYLDYVFPKIFESLDKFSMRTRAIINGFSYSTLKKARKYDENIMLSWVQTYNHQLTTDDVDSANALGNCLITCYDYSGENPATSSNQTDEILAYAQSKNIRIYEAILGSQSLLTNATIYDRGITGAQLEFIPDVFEYF